MVANVSTCSECGQAVPTDAHTLGLCPRCLMRSALVGSRGERRPMTTMDAPNASVLCDALPGLEVLDLIGRGGMGFVYCARQRSLDRLVAVKLFPRDAFADDDPAFAERFANEARILASLSHPNIVAAYEFGETDRFCHLVMELVNGRSLRQRMEKGPIPPPEAIDIARQVCLALEYAHSRGVIHRDVKPENILLELTEGGATRVRVADFGLAKLIQRRPTDFSMTAPNRLMGTPDYMAPEQRTRPADVDARADIYALGVVLYEMLTAQLPLGRFAPPTADARLNRIVLRCLETRPEDRFPSVAEVRQALEEASTRRLKRHWPLIASAAALLLVAAVAVAIYLRPKPQPSANALASATTSTQPIVTSSRPTRAAPAVPHDAGLIAVPIQRDPWPGTRNPLGPAPLPGGGPTSLLDRMLGQFGPDRVVTVIVDDMPGDVRAYIVDRLRDLAGASSTSSSGGGRSVTVMLAPVRDIDTFSKKIDFGKVVKIDPAKRTIEVVCDDPKKLPAPLPPAVKNPADPAFYTQNFSDLGCWDKHRRDEALERLSKAEPTELKSEITAAMTKLATDPESSTRKSALAALAKWSGPSAIPTLAAALRDDDDTWVRRAAIEALGEIKDPRAAQALAAAMPRDRHTAATALKHIGPPAEDTAIALLKHEDGWIRMDAANILQEIGSPKSLPALTKAQNDSDGLVRMAAERAAKSIKDRQQPDNP